VRLPSDKWGFVTRRVTTSGKLDFQSVGSLVRQKLGAEGSREVVGEFQDTHIVQQSEHGDLLGSSGTAPSPSRER
jgi:hypothetical protein